MAYADYWLSGPPAITVSEQGYYSPTTTIQNVMPKDKYAFCISSKCELSDVNNFGHMYFFFPFVYPISGSDI